MKRKIAYLTIVGIALLIQIIYFYEEFYYFNQFRINNKTQAVIHESSEQLSKNMYKLNTHWEFHWNQLIADGYEHRPNIYISVPHYWREIKLKGMKLGAYGYATYRLRVETHKDALFSLKMPAQSSAYKVLINDMIVFESGKVSDDSKLAISSYKSSISNFSAPSDTFYINVQISNYTNVNGGFSNIPLIGNPNEIMRLQMHDIILQSMLAGGIFVVGIYFLIMVIVKNKNKCYFFSALACFNSVIRVFVTGQYIIYNIFPSINNQLVVFIENTTYLLSISLVLLYINRLYPKESNRIIIETNAMISIALSLFSLFIPIRITSKALALYHYFVLIALFYIMFIIIRAIKNKREGAIGTLVGMSILLLSVIIDYLKICGKLSFISTNFIPFGIFSLLLSTLYVLIKQDATNMEKNKMMLLRLNNIERIKNEFLTNTSERLQNPLISILASSEDMMVTLEANLNPLQKETLTSIINNSRNLCDSVNKILEYSRFEYGIISLHKIDFDVCVLIKGIVNEITYIHKDAKINIDCVPNLPNVNADRYRIMQVVYLILNWMLKYIDDLNIQLNLCRDTIYVLFESKHFSKSIIQNIKELNNEHHDNNSLLNEYEIDFRIIKHIIKNHGKEFILCCNDDFSCQFTFGLPVSINIKMCNYPEQSIFDINIIIENDIIKRYHIDGNLDQEIVIVDNNIHTNKSYANALRMQGYTIEGFTDSEEALQYILSCSNASLVIIRLALTGINGIELCKRIREKYSEYEMPIIVLSSQNQTSSIIEALKAGANDCTLLPVDLETLKSRVMTLYKLKIAVQKAIDNEIAFLQAQIEPHFLHNVLNTIIAYCYINPPYAAELIEKLSVFLRYSFKLEPGDKLVPLENEIEFIRAYIELEKSRYNKENDVVFEFDLENTENIFVPTFIIQPLVENAIHHGKLQNKKGGKLIIKGRKQAQEYVISVEDNGYGLSSSDIDLVLSGQKFSGNGIGLKNIRTRLQKIYGTDITMQSEIDNGTKITMTIKIGGKYPC